MDSAKTGEIHVFHRIDTNISWFEITPHMHVHLKAWATMSYIFVVIAKENRYKKKKIRLLACDFGPYGTTLSGQKSQTNT